MLSPMRFKSFTWPHNPHSYSITYERLTAVHKVPMGIYTMQDLGRTRRVLRGEGVFCGPGAYDTFRALACTFYDPGPGLLIHPVWDSANAYFTDLRLEMEPREDYVAYSFAFAEGFFQYSGMKRLSDASDKTAKRVEPVYRTVVYGDTLWAIARDAGLTLAQLLALNPQIGNPNQILPGQRVRVA